MAVDTPSGSQVDDFRHPDIQFDSTAASWQLRGGSRWELVQYSTEPSAQATQYHVHPSALREVALPPAVHSGPNGGSARESAFSVGSSALRVVLSFSLVLIIELGACTRILADPPLERHAAARDASVRRGGGATGGRRFFALRCGRAGGRGCRVGGPCQQWPLRAPRLDRRLCSICEVPIVFERRCVRVARVDGLGGADEHVARGVAPLHCGRNALGRPRRCPSRRTKLVVSGPTVAGARCRPRLVPPVGGAHGPRRGAGGDAAPRPPPPPRVAVVDARAGTMPGLVARPPGGGVGGRWVRGRPHPDTGARRRQGAARRPAGCDAGAGGGPRR